MDIKTICLAVLAQGDATGYEIQKTIKDGPLTHFYDASFGSIYPSLARLTEEELIGYTVVNENGKPERKVYTISAKGRLELSRALAKVSLQDRVRSPFLVSMLFSSLLSPRELYKLIDNRVDVHETVIAKLDKEDETEMTAGERFVQGYARALHSAALDYLKHHRTDIEGDVLLTGLSSQLEETQ